jgi:hypothetical protein
VEDIQLLMQAEDLDFGPVITWWNTPANKIARQGETEVRFDGHRILNNMAGEDEREGGALLYFGLRRPLDLASKSREVPSPLHYVHLARQRQERVWIDIEKPFWWDVPTWLAVAEMDSIGIANNHMCRSQMLANEAWGKPRDVKRLPDPLGNGQWTQEIYYHILNSGIRIPPSAGSASGVLPNPVGYNRVYVYLDNGFSQDAWFKSLALGRCFVTNGPLLRVRANGELPGATLASDGDSAQQVELSIRLTSNDPIAKLEVVHNGRVVDRVACTGETTQAHTTTVALRDSGWLLVRAIADVNYTYRFASTGPWYLDPPTSGPRISRQSAQFFVDWIDERIARVQANIDDAEDLQAVRKWHVDARAFWSRRRDAANAD